MRLGLGDGPLPSLPSPADEVLRGALEELEARNRKLAADNKRLQVEAVSWPWPAAAVAVA
jgi:hypothetical protein